MTFPWLASILQTADPLFPIGSYAHSYGLEEFVANGEVDSVDTLIHYLDTVVALNLQEFELPYMRFAREAVEQSNWEELCSLDEEISAAKLSKELRHASAAQGQQRLRIIRKLRPSRAMEKLSELKRSKQLVPNHLIVFAAEIADGKVPTEAALATWAYQALAAPCAASLKLFRIGQEGAQMALGHALNSLGTIVAESLSVERAFAGAYIPNLDIASHRHERAYARLFIS